MIWGRGAAKPLKSCDSGLGGRVAESGRTKLQRMRENRVGGRHLPASTGLGKRKINELQENSP